MAHRLRKTAPPKTTGTFDGESLAGQVVRKTGIGPFSGTRIQTPERRIPELAQPSAGSMKRTIDRALGRGAPGKKFR